MGVWESRNANRSVTPTSAKPVFRCPRLSAPAPAAPTAPKMAHPMSTSETRRNWDFPNSSQLCTRRNPAKNRSQTVSQELTHRSAQSAPVTGRSFERASDRAWISPGSTYRRRPFRTTPRSDRRSELRGSSPDDHSPTRVAPSAPCMASGCCSRSRAYRGSLGACTNAHAGDLQREGALQDACGQASVADDVRGQAGRAWVCGVDCRRGRSDRALCSDECSRVACSGGASVRVRPQTHTRIRCMHHCRGLRSSRCRGAGLVRRMDRGSG